MDIIVVGTGAAGLTAAVVAAERGARVTVVEKAPLVGGTAAWSGGQVWIPNNPHMREAGISDDRERAITYVMSLSRDMLERELIEAYVDAGPEMVSMLEATTPVQFYAVPGMPDYHPEFPGGSPDGGRTIECPLFPFDELGDWAERVTPSPYFADPHITMSETPLGKAIPDPPSKAELERRDIRNERGCGQALIGRLLKACLDRGVEPVTSCAARELIVEEGKVVGLLVEGPDGPAELRASNGVILASGGFEWDRQLVRSFLRGPMTHPVSMETNTGDGLRMAMRAGAMLSNMREAWWIPVASVPQNENPMGRVLINGQRTLPHSIMVNKRGRRFTNEAANYNAFGAAFHVEDVSRFEYANLPCWLVFDQTYVDKYGFRVASGIEAHGVPKWVIRGDTPAALADRLAIDPDGLTATIRDWNAQCAQGNDPDFGRGDSAFDRWWGDPYLKGKAEATLGPLERGPYYAVEIHSGCLGTKGGPRVDRDARVLDVDGAPIQGLYAAGNVMGSPFGMTYGGPGGTLGPAMVFGYLAALHATS
ncbi:MAG TPA: FAD-dependent oxidoreductase [Acidimicrobiales bacterium]|nr:FAD-dependent oxidoreductase [Acidimicrobiales bacterium]